MRGPSLRTMRRSKTCFDKFIMCYIISSTNYNPPTDILEAFQWLPLFHLCKFTPYIILSYLLIVFNYIVLYLIILYVCYITCLAMDHS